MVFEQSVLLPPHGASSEVNRCFLFGIIIKYIKQTKKSLVSKFPQFLHVLAFIYISRNFFLF